MSRLADALAEHDALIAECPVNNPKRGKFYRPDEKCPRCSALASGSCGLAASAGYQLAGAVRRIVKAEQQ